MGPAEGCLRSGLGNLFLGLGRWIHLSAVAVEFPPNLNSNFDKTLNGYPSYSQTETTEKMRQGEQVKIPGVPQKGALQSTTHPLSHPTNMGNPREASSERLHDKV